LKLILKTCFSGYCRKAFCWYICVEEDMQRIITFIAVFILLSISNFSYSQFESSYLSINVKRSIPSNFVNAELQLGNDKMHFFTLQGGYHFSSYESNKYSPYFINKPDLNLDYVFSNYISKKNGFNAGLGYNYYFLNLENKKQLIPSIGADLNWYRSKDNFSLNYTEAISGGKLAEEKTHIFHTFSAVIHGGFIITSDLFFFKTQLVAEFLLPMNSTFYLASDDYNPRSSRKLPFNGIEPGIQLGFGFKLF